MTATDSTMTTLLFPYTNIFQEAREPSCRTPSSSVCTPGNPNTPKTVPGNNVHHTPKAGLANQLHTPKATTAGNNPHTPMSERQQLALIRHMEEEGRGECCNRKTWNKKWMDFP